MKLGRPGFHANPVTDVPAAEDEAYPFCISHRGGEVLGRPGIAFDRPPAREEHRRLDGAGSGGQPLAR